MSMSIEQTKKILMDRAKVLALEGKDETASGERIQIIEFRLSNEKYAIESVYIREVLPLKELAVVPCTPPYILGVINVRGQILSIIDLRVFFELPRETATRATKIIVLSSNEMELGIVADAVTGARSIPLDQVHVGLPTLIGIREIYLRGVVGDDLVFLDAAKLLADKLIVVDEEVEE
ncbi:MAG: chemotaxis protein CheW [Desulfosporosinus sp.]|nr:chemotaxis protein CheW [Desulfosporosinus sp.]